MKLKKEYTWDTIDVLKEFEDTFGEECYSDWVQKNNIVKNTFVVFPVETTFKKENEDDYFIYYTVTLPNGSSCSEFPINVDFVDELEECY